MNKLIDAIKCNEIGKVPTALSPLINIRESVDQLEIQWNYATEYRIGLEIGATQLIPQEIIKQTPGALDEAIYQVKRAIVEELYGDFRKKLYELSIQMRQEQQTHGSKSIELVEELIEMTQL